MRVIDPHVPRTAIDVTIRAASFGGHDPARWALPLLDCLEGDATGWMLVELEPDDMASLWLPEHAGEPCHGDSMRLGSGAGGATLQAAGDWLDGHATAYGAANPSCWARITQASREEVSPLVVAAQSVGDRVKPDAAALVVVDGLHRALGYWLSGRRTCQAYLPRHD